MSVKPQDKLKQLDQLNEVYADLSEDVRTKRTTLPHEQRVALARELRRMLKDEHERYQKSQGYRSPFSITRATTATGIPWRTLGAYINAQRVPGVTDLYRILTFAGEKFEDVMARVLNEKPL